jgi:hypothetical protein
MCQHGNGLAQCCCKKMLHHAPAQLAGVDQEPFFGTALGGVTKKDLCYNSATHKAPVQPLCQSQRPR